MMKKGLKITIGTVTALVAVAIILSLLRPAGGQAGGAAALPGGGFFGSGPVGTRAAVTGGDAAASDAAVVRLGVSGTGTVEDIISLSGEVNATGAVNVVPETNGLLTRILVKPGDRVVADQVVAWVDPSRPGMSYSESPVRSKTSGTVTSVPAIAGNQVSTQTVVAQVGNLRELDVDISVPEKHLGQLRFGMEGYITSRAFPDDIQSATVVEISPVVDSRSRTVAVTLKPDVGSSLRPGQSVDVNLILDSRSDVVMVDSSALTERSGGEGVFVSEDSFVRWQPVTTGVTVAGQVEVVRGLESGTPVVIAGLERITDGSAIRVVEG